MAERFVSPCPPPTPYEAEVLTILIEECAEVIKCATKILRFGVGDTQSGKEQDNKIPLSTEIGGLQYMIDLVDTVGLVDIDTQDEAYQVKRKRLKVYMQHQE